MSSKTKTDTTTQQNKLDPRMDALLYGDNGILGRANTLSQQPAINDLQRKGIDAQANYLQSPLYSQIFNQILGQGQSLTGRGVAANPYSGSMGFGGGTQGGYSPNYTPQVASNKVQVPVILGNQQPQQNQLTPEMMAYLQKMMASSGSTPHSGG